MFRIDLAPVNRRENAKAIARQAHIVAVARGTGRNDPAAIDLAHQAVFERMYELRSSAMRRIQRSDLTVIVIHLRSGWEFGTIGARQNKQNGGSKNNGNSKVVSWLRRESVPGAATGL